MRAAMIIDSLRIGGAQKLVTQFVSAVPRQNIESTVISLRGDPVPSNLEIIHSAGAEVKLFPSRSLLDVRRLRQLIRFLRMERFDLIQTHLSYANILGCLAGYFAGIPVIATLHSTGHDPQHKDRLITRLEELILRFFARRILAVGYTVAATFQNRLGARSLDIIPNGVPAAADLSPEAKRELRCKIAGQEDSVIIIAIGRFVPAKGYEDLIKAFAILHRQDPQAILVIAGVGKLFEQIKRQISALHLDEVVHCLGERNDVPQLLAASDIYVISSHWEGLPMALLEAMMAGLPTVATSVGDIPKVLTPETGIVVPPHEPASLAEALHNLVRAPEHARALGAAARARAIKDYSLETWAKKLTSLYEETLSC
jgi:glycosyltransferase involved in cell wall biosynthesis